MVSNEMQYWDGGFPLSGESSGSMQYWDDGFPAVYILPTAASSGSASLIKSSNGVLMSMIKTFKSVPIVSIKKINGVVNV